MSISQLAAACMGYDVEDSAAVNLTGETFEQAGALPFAEAGRVLYVEQELYLCLTAVDVLASGTSAA